MLNGLCGAGSRLSHCLGALVQDTSSPCHTIVTQCQAIWEELVKATAVATSAVKSQVLATLQEINTSGDTDADTHKSHEQNQFEGLVASASGVWQLDDVHQPATFSSVLLLQQAVCGSLMTFINLQHQFCIACCEFVGTMALSSCCQQTVEGRHDSDCSVGVVQHFFSRLYSPAPAPATTQHRSPLHFPPCSLQRRWSEAAAAEMTGESQDGTMRRWSMPWESSRLAEPHSTWHGRLNPPPSKLAVPSTASQDRSRSITPGVTLTSYPYDGPPPEWGEDRTPTRRASSSPQPPVHHQTHRASWHALESHSHMWGDPDSGHCGERNSDMYSSAMDATNLASRKSSSSTDSSSSHSLHSRSTTGSEGGAEVRSHLYSMWSGSDLAFMKLSESSEPVDGATQGDGGQITDGAGATHSQTFYTSPK
uniref:DUF4745 domain-containing protein n=1 Tax=Timema bartmani TaxID=61472 RepID=A0A7R9ETL0_9NEOP|nr:unnamed protein product [Timema bartmani]